MGFLSVPSFRENHLFFKKPSLFQRWKFLLIWSLMKDGKPSFQKKCLSPPSTWSNGTFFFKTGRGSGIYAFFSWTKKQQATFECWGKPSFWTLIRWGFFFFTKWKEERTRRKKKNRATMQFSSTHNYFGRRTSYLPRKLCATKFSTTSSTKA